MKFLILISILFATPIFAQTEIEKRQHEKAKKEFNDGHYALAKFHFKELILKNPSNYEAISYKLRANLLLGQYSNTFDDCNLLIEKDTFLHDAYFSSASSNMGLENYQLALEDFNKLLELDSVTSNDFFSRGLARMALKKYEKAIKDFTHCIELDSGYLEAYTSRATCKGLLGKQDDACLDLLIGKQMGSQKAIKLLEKNCHITEVSVELGSCIERDCVSPLLINFKIAQCKNVKTEDIVGKWEMISSLMTWRDTTTNQVNATYLMGEYQIKYEFFPSGKGRRYNKKKVINVDWEWNGEGQLKIHFQNEYNVVEEVFINANSNFLEMMHPAEEGVGISGLQVFKKIKD